MEALLQRLEPYVEHVCKPIAMQDAADAAQESMIAIYRNLHHLEKPGSLLGWVRIISLREAARVARLSGRAVAAELTEMPMASTPQLAAEIRDVLGRLTPEHRAMLTLRHVAELDEQTVARSLGLPLGTVRSRLYRARRAFRDAWG
jgi:RNA polymerase sigma factor (sigma-70 family)